MAKFGAKTGRAANNRKALTDKIADGNVSHRTVKVIKFTEKERKNDTAKAPKLPKYFTEAQKNDIPPLRTQEIYDAAWEWIKERGCSRLIAPQLLERYAMASARWIQCEQIMSSKGLEGEHPTTHQPTQSPCAVLADRYLSQANRLWTEIFQIIRENCLTDYSGATPQEDVMEKLLRSPKKENVV